MPPRTTPQHLKNPHNNCNYYYYSTSSANDVRTRKSLHGFAKKLRKKRRKN